MIPEDFFFVIPIGIILKIIELFNVLIVIIPKIMKLLAIIDYFTLDPGECWKCL